MPAVFPPILVAVGTSPILLLANWNRRKQYIVVFPATTKIAGNTGIVYVGIGQVPNATAGVGQQGHSMIAGETFGESMLFPGDVVSTDAIYAVASAGNQIIEVYQSG